MYDEDDEETTRTFKIIIIGDTNVGKTCLAFRFCGGRFPEKTEATIGVDFREKRVTIDGEEMKLQLWDTAGQERFRQSMVPHYYRNVSAVVFVYDITRRSTFESIPKWFEECERYATDRTIPRILVGNKSDDEENREVANYEAQRLADTHGMPLFETSAMEDERTDHIDGIFMTLAHRLKASKPLSTTTTSVSPNSTSEASEIRADGGFRISAGVARSINLGKEQSSHGTKQDCSC